MLRFGLLFAFFFCIPLYAQAYLDGGTGSMILQFFLGGLAVAGSFIKIYWFKIKFFFCKKKDN